MPVHRQTAKAEGIGLGVSAPRFDASGGKIENARFVKVAHNGVVVQEDVELKGPTRSSMPGPETARGPLMLQGDHGPVAYRNIRIKLLD